jgi:hypothetical protein
MKASFRMLSAAVVVCVAHAAALAQYPGRLDTYRPNMDIPPNWQSGPGGTWPVRPSGPVGPQGPNGPNIPGIGRGFFGSESGPGSFSPQPGIIPREPRPSDFIDQGRSGNSNPGAAQIPPELLSQLTIPVVPKIEPLFAPAPLPGAAPARPVPPAAPPWQGWVWVAAGIGVLCLLARLLRTYAERKDTAR